MTESGEVDVRVDGACIGSGMCAAGHPELFTLDDDRRAVLVAGVQPSADDATEAAWDCPVGAISVMDRATGARLAP